MVVMCCVLSYMYLSSALRAAHSAIISDTWGDYKFFAPQGWHFVLCRVERKPVTQSITPGLDKPGQSNCHSAVEVDWISVSAPKLVKSLVSAWFRFWYVKPRQVSFSAETVSEFQCWPKLGSCCLHQFFRAELYVIAVPPPSARIYPMQCDGTAGRARRAPHSSTHLQLHCCSICSLLVSTRVVSPGGLSLSFAAYNSAAAHAGRLPEHHVSIRQANSSMPAVLTVVM